MKRLMMLCLGMLAVAGARAQERNGERVVELDLQRAIEIALDENPTIKVADMEIERQTYVKKETQGMFLPSLSADGMYTRAIKQATMGGLPMGSDNTLQGGATLGLPLYMPALFRTLKLNDEQMRAAVEAARGSRITLANDVKKAYYSILLSEELLAVLRSSERTITQTVENTRTMYENDMASEYDLVTAEVQLSNLQPSIYEAESAVASTRKMLGMLLGLPADVRVVIDDNLSGLALQRPQDYIRDVEGNSDLRALGIQGNMLERQLGVLKTQRMPNLAAFGNVTFTGQDQISNFGEVMAGLPKKTEFKWQHPINVGAQLNIPIFAGRTNIRKEQQLKNQIDQLGMQRDYMETGLRVEVDNAIATVATARSKMTAGEKTIAQAQKGYDISKVRYEAGMGTILELNSAELSLTQARLTYTSAIYDYLAAQADYEKIIGKE